MPTGSTPTTKSSVWVRSHAVWVFTFVLFARLLVLANFSHSVYLVPDGEDMKFYNDWALRIAKGVTDPHAFYGLPGYAYFLAGVYSLAGFNPYVIGFLQCVSEAFIGVVLFQLAQTVFDSPGASKDRLLSARGKVVGAIAVTGWVFLEPAQAFSVILMPTTWLVLAYWGCVLWIIRTPGDSWWNPWFWMGLLCGVVAMMVATILFLIVLIFAAVLAKLDRGKPLAVRLPKILLAWCAVIAGVLLGISPCWMHNYFIAKEPVLLSAHSGVNFYIGNNPVANGYPKIPPGLRAGQEGMLKDSITMAEKAEGHPLTRAEVSRFWSNKANQYIHSHFSEWLELMALKFRNFWSSFQYDDICVVTLFRADGILIPGIRFGLVAALGIPGMIIAYLRFPRSRWVSAAVFLHMCALLPVFITERYRLAAAPGLLLMAGLGLWELWNSLVFGRWGEVAAYCSLSALSTLFVSWPQSAPGLWSLDYYNTGIKATAAGNLERARFNLELAYDYVPENSEINFALGNLWVKEGDTRKAKAFYRRALEINPRHGGAYNNLGMLAMNEHRWEVAARFLRLSLEIEPDDAKTHFLLAQTLLQENELAGAREEVKRALEINPARPEFQALEAEIEARHPR